MGHRAESCRALKEVVGVRRLSRRRKTVVALVAAGIVAGTGVGVWAYWTSGGGGSGTVSSGSVSTIVVNQTSNVSGLAPSGQPKDLLGNFDNPNPGGIFVHQVTAALASVTGAGTDPLKPACTTGDFALTSNPVTVDATVPTGNGVGGWGPIRVALVDSAANQDNCQGATVHLTYTSN
jgi:hypothetical protein